ncbi:cation-translocating P-type ATPase [Extensimonas vulgaris]|uniref:Ca2+-transporting ATPase n=1 Tax=Extensimonas vulgaris TaxID=1031594 RepID=A0A369AGH5_9BURK|nr:cation-translocating P-type ATPase [Extensimonas vulgaris]RCX08233.1 Ca2+-transporting ATPase [Extensimonas vulgaris]TWI37494.1 Ca2+-transporting ATPase [Extensimonas vulgaris]TXD13824.1 cation-translocating P-type ATPase [Extensimonas vulgaris]
MAQDDPASVAPATVFSATQALPDTQTAARWAASAHLHDVAALARALDVDLRTGLSPQEAARRAAQYGPNSLAKARRRSALALLAEQFQDFMVLVLLAAAVVSGFVGEFTDTLVILVIVVLNALIGFVQAWRADQAIAALRKLAAAQASVLRGGLVQTLPAHALVPGDVVLLEAGNQIPADLRLFEVVQFQVDESALTGESVSVAKQTAPLPPQEGSALGERSNMAFKGTAATAGRARGLVVATGMHTELGKIAQLLDTEDRSTPLQRRLAAFGRRLALVVLGICLVIFVAGVLRGEDPLRMALTAISLAVAAIPEALPAVVTVLLALGARRMVAAHALVRRLPAVETLGSVTVICSDKTGTLTQNRMHVELLLAAGERWAPGEPASPVHTEALRAAALCNDAVRQKSAENGDTKNTADHADEVWLGDPTETALVLAALSAGLDKVALDAALPRVQEQPFDSSRQRMTTFHRLPAGDGGAGYVAYTKGAPESVLPCCRSQWTPTGDAPLDTSAVLAAANALAAQGLRVLALARREHARLPDTNDLAACRTLGVDSEKAPRRGQFLPDSPPHSGTMGQEDGKKWAAAAHSQPTIPKSDRLLAAVENALQFLGLVALIDPPRPEAAAAVRDCQSAGIVPVMITGDHPATARAIALRLGIVASADAPVLTGKELAELDAAALRARIEQVRVYARVDPAQKIRIVEALQALGHFVAMTGDGVNDAPALKRADIGVAMGRGGTDVAREAASLVLLDDNFATIVAAVREGRRIYDNIRKFVRYAMSGNSAEIWTILLAPMVLLPIPLQPIHILWINLVTDGLPGLALAAEPAEPDVMRRPPRPPRESLFARGLWQDVLGMGLLIAGLCLAVQAWALHTGRAHAQTMVFTVLTLSQMTYLLAIRCESAPLWRVGLASNRPLLGAVLLTFLLQLGTIYVPWLQPIFKTEPLSAFELGICLAASLLVYLAAEASKAWWRARQRRGALPASSAVDDT